MMVMKRVPVEPTTGKATGLFPRIFMSKVPSYSPPLGVVITAGAHPLRYLRSGENLDPCVAIT